MYKVPKTQAKVKVQLLYRDSSSMKYEGVQCFFPLKLLNVVCFKIQY